MKKFLLILLFLLTFVLNSCTLPENSQGNTNQNDMYYIVSFDTNYGSFIESKMVKDGESISKPQDPVKENFRFVYWTLNDVEYDFNSIVTSNLILTAKWEEVGVHTHFYSSNVVAPTCVQEGYTEYTCECGDIYKDDYVGVIDHELYTVNHRMATTVTYGYGDVEFCINCEYTEGADFALSNTYEDLEVYEFNGQQYINFGSYPQSHVYDVFLVEELNKLTETNSSGYYEYNGCEYVKVITSPLHGHDTDYMNFNPTYKYFDGEVLYTGITEWFKVEPIVWRILSVNDDETYLLFSDFILDSSLYSNINEIIYDLNYESSYIRQYLNSDFYNKAFNQNDMSFIQSVEITNDMFDNVFLLSYDELCNTEYGFTDSVYDINRRAQVSDYAIATGAYYDYRDSVNQTKKVYQYGNGIYWYRLDNAFVNPICYVDEAGNLNIQIDVSKNYVGVRPAITIKL